MSNTGKNKQLISGTLIYAIGSFGTKILNFLIVPLYTYYIAPDAMGEYDLLITVVSFLIPLLTVQIGDSVYRELISDSYSAGMRGPIINAAAKVLLCDFLLTIIGSVLFYLFSGYEYIGYFVAIMIGNSLFTVLQKTLRGFHKQKLFALSGLFYTIIFLALNLMLICGLHLGIRGMLLSNAISYICGALFILIAEANTRPMLPFKPCSLSDLEKSMLKYAIPLIPNQLNWWVMNSSDRFIIRYFLGNTANGIYAISYKFPTMLQSIFSLFTNSFQDISVGEDDSTPRSQDEPEQGQYYSDVFDKYSVFVLSTIILAIPVSKLYIRLFMDSAYHEAACYIGYLYLGCAFQSFAAYYGVGYLKLKKTAGASSTSIYGALANIIVNIVFIRFWGLYAAAISTAVGFALMWIFRIVQVGKKLGIRINILHMSLFGLSAILFAVLSSYTRVRTDIILSGLGLIIFVFANKDLFTKFKGKNVKSN